MTAIETAADARSGRSARSSSCATPPGARHGATEVHALRGVSLHGRARASWSR